MLTDAAFVLHRPAGGALSEINLLIDYR